MIIVYIMALPVVYCPDPQPDWTISYKTSKPLNQYYDSKIQFFSLFIQEFFSIPYSEEFKANKKFAVSTLKTYGFGTKGGETKILDQIDYMSDEIEKAGGDPISPKKVCSKVSNINSFNRHLMLNISIVNINHMTIMTI